MRKCSPVPKMRLVTDDWYPSASRRISEEGRVLVEFHLDERRKPLELTIRTRLRRTVEERHRTFRRSGSGVAAREWDPPWGESGAVVSNGA
jgi:hypothetical protein